MERIKTPELMDDPGVPRDELDRSLRYLRRANRWFGGARALIRHLEPWSARWPRGTTITLLDIATGSADVPIAVRRWAIARGLDVRVTAIDAHETTVELARLHAGGVDGITILRADARRLLDDHRDRSFDYVHAGLFLHHLPEIEVLTVLRIMDRLAARGLVWNDLVRSPVATLLIDAAVIGQPRIIRHDARVSVRKGFTRREVIDFARRLDLSYTSYHRGPLFHRFTLAGEKPGAWPAPPGGGP